MAKRSKRGNHLRPSGNKLAPALPDRSATRTKVQHPVKPTPKPDPYCIRDGASREATDAEWIRNGGE